MDLARLIEEIRSDPDYRGQIQWLHEIPPGEARYAPLQVELHPVVRQILADLGIEQLYVHQVQAIEAALRGEHVVTVTGTASGKTLTYVVPLVQRLYERPARRALLLYPTKALAQDQLRKLTDFGAGSAFHAATYDGDTPRGDRRRIKREAQVVLTNPDMLHIGILPYHQTWSDFFSNLQFVVVDEVHSYRGVFGSHTANVIRRLRRICEGYGSNPQFIASSATIGNPGEHFTELTGGLEPTVIDEDTAPRGRRFLVLWRPPELVEGVPEVRRSANMEAAELMAELVKAHVRTIVFVFARRVAELVLRYAREGLAEFEDLAERIMSYRGGYLPEERREIERKLFEGELLGVVSTSALEVGVDIGGLDAAILNGFPGTISSTWQQIGRSGRGMSDSLAIVVTPQGGVHRYILQHPEYLLEAENERATINPRNRYILAGHLLCAAYERPIEDADAGLFGEEMEAILQILADPDYRDDSDLPFVAKRTRWYWVDPNVYPAGEISLRSAGGRPWQIRLTDGGDLLATVDAASALRVVHSGAVYLHAGESYVVERLDLEAETAWVRQEEPGYYTRPRTHSRMSVMGWEMERQTPSGSRVLLGDLQIEWRVIGYVRVRPATEQELGRFPLELPADTIETVGLTIAPGEADIEALAAGGYDLMGTLHALEHAMIALLPIFAFCDIQDVGGISEIEHEDLKGPVLSVYDWYDGGVGIAEIAYERLDDLLRAVAEQIECCPCEDGCPECVQAAACGNDNVPLDKAGALLLARRLVGEERRAVSRTERPLSRSEGQGSRA
ncbi:MAG: DEAD/DEAH box helicase [candidate division WS1 bacterium]|nr:DEAD/DEAH box helicase [candidate division WS1 bacterium]